MDPNANLQEQERILASRSAAILGARLLDLRQALIDWLAGGGFEPDWSKAPNARKYYGR